jgi:uncharacterized protein (DUF1778 family)
VTKDFLVEHALLHHLLALDELPASAVMPPRIVVTEASARRIAAMLSRPRAPTPAMRKLISHGRRRRSR